MTVKWFECDGHAPISDGAACSDCGWTFSATESSGLCASTPSDSYIWGVFDEHEQTFVRAFCTELEAIDYALTLEVPRLDRWLRWTVARIPADDPLVVES